MDQQPTIELQEHVELYSKYDLKVGDVVQIDPSHDPVFGGCFMIVTEPKSWGAQGYINVPGERGGYAYYRCKHANMQIIGRCEWMEER